MRPVYVKHHTYILCSTYVHISQILYPNSRIEVWVRVQVPLEFKVRVCEVEESLISYFSSSCNKFSCEQRKSFAVTSTPTRFESSIARLKIQLKLFSSLLFIRSICGTSRSRSLYPANIRVLAKWSTQYSTVYYFTTPFMPSCLVMLLVLFGNLLLKAAPEVWGHTSNTSQC